MSLVMPVELQVAAPAGASGADHRNRIRRSLARRHRAERRFQLLGSGAALAALCFLLVLFANVLGQGLPAFRQLGMEVDVHFDKGTIRLPAQPQAGPDLSPAGQEAALLAWRRRLAMVNWNALILEAVRARAPQAEADDRQILSVIDPNARLVL